jgi:hypothetical protein
MSPPRNANAASLERRRETKMNRREANVESMGASLRPKPRACAEVFAAAIANFQSFVREYLEARTL